MAAADDCDVAFLRDSGTAHVLSALVRQLLIERPQDPVQHFIHRLEKKHIGLALDDLLAMLSAPVEISEAESEHEETTHRTAVPFQLLVEALFDVQPTNFAAFPLVASSDNGAAKDYGGLGPFVSCMQRVAEALSEVLQREESEPSTFTLSLLNGKGEGHCGGSPTSAGDNASFASAASGRSAGGTTAQPLPSLREKEVAAAHRCEELFHLAVERVAASRVVPAFVRAVGQLAISRLKLEAAARRNDRLVNAQRAAEAAAIAQQLASAGDHGKDGGDGAKDEASAGHGSSKSKSAAGAKETAPAAATTPAPSLSPPLVATSVCSISVDVVPAPEPFTLHVVLPLRLASDFADHFAVEVLSRIEWALKTSFPSAETSFYFGEESYDEVRVPGRDGVDPTSAFPGSVVRAVVREVHRQGLQNRVRVFADRDGGVAASGFMTAIANAARFPPKPQQQSGKKRLVVVIESSEAIFHLGSIGNLLFPLLLCDTAAGTGAAGAQVPLTPPPHMGGAAATPQTASSSPAETPGGKGGVATASKKQQQQQQQLASAAAANALTASQPSTGPFVVLATCDAEDTPITPATAVAAAVHHKLVAPWVRGGGGSAFTNRENGGSFFGFAAIAFDAAAFQPIVPEDDERGSLLLPNLLSTLHYHPSLLPQLALVIAERSASALQLVHVSCSQPLRPAVRSWFFVGQGFIELAHAVTAWCAPAVSDKERGDARRHSEALAKALIACGDGVASKLEALAATDSMRRVGAAWLSYAESMDGILAALSSAAFTA